MTGTPRSPAAPAPPSAVERTLSARLVLDCQGGPDLALAVAAARAPGWRVQDALEARSGEGPGAQPLVPQELVGARGERTHLLRAVPDGRVVVEYTGSAASGPGPQPVAPADHGRDERGEDAALERLVALRPSRYCPSDELAAYAAAQFGTLADRGAAELARAVRDDVAHRLAYTAGSSTAFDGAVQTLLRGQGVCRDFAHLVVALCRALEVPARLAAVYAPGLAPMDFHAVAEVRADGAWQVLDATGLAPRPALVRIATGRDAADTAFLTTLGGRAELVEVVVTATTAGDLPGDDGGPVALG